VSAQDTKGGTKQTKANERDKCAATRKQETQNEPNKGCFMSDTEMPNKTNAREAKE
jgi:hypothetical protein